MQPGSHHWPLIVVAAAVVGAVAAGAVVVATRTEPINTIVPAAAPTEPAPPSAIEVLPPDESYAGATLGEWGARWSQWTLSLPEEINPGSETTGQACGYGQNGPVFFLPALLGRESLSYDCVVPEGTAIYVGWFVSNCSSVEAPPHFGGNEQELRACIEATAPPPPSGWELSINGQAVDDIESYRTTTPMFTVNVVEGRPDALSWIPPGVALVMVVTNGVIIAPPPPGEYVIHSAGGGVGTINVTVEAPQINEP
jgi:hypothetical protein